MRNNVINYTQLNTTNNEIFVAKFLLTIYIYNNCSTEQRRVGTGEGGAADPSEKKKKILRREECERRSLSACFSPHSPKAEYFPVHFILWPQVTIDVSRVVLRGQTDEACARVRIFD